jgi:hypothetical protein
MSTPHPDPETLTGELLGKPSAARLTQRSLADRWNVSEKTLERWRWAGKGPRYLKLGARVVYPLEEVERFEASSLRGGR